MKITVETKFGLDDKVWYCPRIKEENTIIYKAHIISVEISHNPKSLIRYTIDYKREETEERHRCTADENNLYKSKTNITDAMREKRKKELVIRTSYINKKIQSFVNELGEINEKLDEIKKEELTIELSGIS